MISVSEIRERLNQFVAGSLALDDFEDWLVSASWNMHLDSDPIAQALVSAVELRLAEHSEGHLPMGQMIEEFRALLEGKRILNVRLNADPVVHGGGSSIDVERVVLPDPIVERQPVTVYELLSRHPG